MTIGLGVVAVFGTVFGVVSFFKYFFYLDEDELIIEKGVFKKKHINIPFERIQTVDFSQNIIHQIFNVVALKIDTAGSAGTEFEFDALSKEKAEALRQLIFKRKAEVSQLEASTDDISTPVQALTQKPILTLAPGRLLLVGLTENHFRSFGLILLFGFWIMDSLEEIGFGWDYLEDNIESAGALFAGLAMAVSLAIFFMLLSMVISLVRTVLKYFDLKFVRQGLGFKVTSGLITRRETAAMDNKIQIVQWSSNLLQKFLGFFEIHLKQASSVAINAKKSIKVPGASIDQVEEVQKYLYTETDLIFDNKFKVSQHYFIRPAIYIVSLGILHSGAMIYFGSKFVLPIIIFYILILISRYLKYKKTSYQFNPTMLKINGGTYGHDYSLLPIHKIQSIQKKQNYYQRRRGLASVRIHTASGDVGIPYITEDTVEELMDFFTYTLEKSEQYWM